MGTKDHPQKSNLLLHVLLAGGIAAGSIGGYISYDKITELESKVEKRDQAINAQGKKLEEQGSLIDRQQKEIQGLRDDNTQLKDDLEKQKALYQNAVDSIKKHQSTIKEKDAQINSLKGRLTTAAKQGDSPSRSIMPSRGEAPKGRTITVEATGYIAMCSEGCTGITATGINLKKNPNMKVIAVDPRIIPLGSKVYVPGYGYAIAGDTGGAIKGNKIDLHMPSTQSAREWGRRTVQIKILN